MLIGYWLNDDVSVSYLDFGRRLKGIKNSIHQ